MDTLIKKYKKFLDDKKPQTTNKIKYVTNYVKNWLFVWNNNGQNSSINFIDCMCNAGIYLDGGYCTSIEVLNLFINSAKQHPEKTYNLFFNDGDSVRITILKDVINIIYNESLPNLNIVICNSDVNNYLQSLLRNITLHSYKTAILLYVDPYDFGTVQIPILKQFCETYYCELLYNVFTSDWVRNKNNEMDNRIDKVINNPSVKIESKQELLEYIISQLKVKHMKYAFSYEFHTQTNTELYQILFLTPNEKGLEKLKDALWETFKGANYYRSLPTHIGNEQISLFSSDVEGLDGNLDNSIISYNASLAKNIVLSLKKRQHLAFNEIAIPVLEKTMLKKNDLITYVFTPLIKDNVLTKLNENVRKNNYKDDYYNIRG